jgi:cytochrome c peroxidase
MLPSTGIFNHFARAGVTAPKQSQFAMRIRLGVVASVCALALLGAATGLDHAFPPMPGEAPTTERAELGRLLFFDPVLSRDGSLSCAHCHRPDRGFADGLVTARGRGGAALARNTPTLYNAAFKPRLMWDRRAASLEEQVLLPLLALDELAADPAQLLAKLAAIPEYRERFAAAFPDDAGSAAKAAAPGISLANLARALAAFERTLVSRASRFDRFARGERAALSASERNGLTLFRSLATRCFECHRLPTFDAPLAQSVGVPSPDAGAGAITGLAAQHGFFGVPTLRNVALTAPYMHDGSLAKLEHVVEFYRRGGGLARGVPASRLHEFVRPIEMTDAEAVDLVAFLRALTDESARPALPEWVPSGLPVLAGLAP